MDAKAALKARLATLSPEQRSALLQKLARLREQDSGQEPVAGPYPLSLAQRRLWLLSQLGSQASAAYNIASAFSFDNVLDPTRLRSAWRRLLADHDVLRSSFRQDGDSLVQEPRAASDWDLQQHTLAADQAPDAQLVQLARSAAAQPFDLQQDWLLRVIYCETAAGQGARAAGLIVVIHHIVCDGISIACMIRELAQYYAQASAGEDAAALPTRPAALQYRDYVGFEAGMDTGKARAYWRQIFASAPETLDALLDQPRPARKDFTGAAHSLTLDASQVAAFEALCHAGQATLYMGLVALTQLVLARMANVDEVTLGTPVAGRPGAQFGQVVGPFVNTVALRQVVRRDESFGELLQQVRRAVLGGFEHQGLAFDELVTALGFDKDPSRSPLYDVMLGLNSADELTLVFGDSAGRPLRIAPAFSKVDLTFHFEKQTDGSLRLDMEYACAVLRATTVQRLGQALQLLFVAVPQAPTGALGAFALQTPDARRALLEQVNATARPYPQQASLAGEFRRTVAAYPDAIAVHAGEVQLSYHALDQLSDALAAHLLQQPAHVPGCRIALLLEKDERALIVILAILKSGSVYVPLAANTPLERVAQVLEAGAVPLLFAEANRCAELQSVAAVVLDTDALLRAIAARQQQGQGQEQCSALPVCDETQAAATPAYLMFTSGSTGKPKGTLIEQRSVLRLVCNTDYHQVQAHERVLLTGSLAFDAATFEIWGPLLNGGCVCIPSGTTLLDVHEFRSLVDHYQVDTAFLTTGLFNQLVDNSVAAFGRLRCVLTGGEKISVEHVRKLLQAHPALDLLHVYGPTENTTFSSWHRIAADDLLLPTIPIGRPIANSRLYLLDAAMQPVPIGVPGEIYCGGDGIARGYLEQPGSAQPDVFLPDPFVPDGSGRLYRTGDLAKWNERLELVFLGRNDRQVKIRGFRVELGEVEFHLRQLPGITDAYVQARGAAGTSELVAWLVTPAGDSITLAAVRDALKGSVPAYMLPAKIVCMERLPLNASGKVDARALPEPDLVDAAVVEAGQLYGKVEQDLARLYAKVLGLPDSAASGIDRGANFFSLGGDSIRAIQLVSLARAAGYHFALKDIFASETLAGLAATASVAAPAGTAVALRSGPLSPTQLWWLEQRGMPANHFNLSSVFRVAGTIDLAALRAALDAMLALHPALRLRLDPDSGQQHIRDSGSFVLRVVDAVQSRQQCWEALQQAIDLDAGILLAVGVAPEGAATYLAVVVHHLAADEVSGRLFAENLTRLYRRELAAQQGATQGAAPDALHEALGHINWAAQLQTVVQQGGMDQDLVYWTDSVAQGRQVLQRQQDVFTVEDVPRTEVQLTLAVRETGELLQRGHALLRMTPQELLLAAFIRAWQRTLGHADCLLMLEGHGRESYPGLGDCSSTLGWFTSLYPFVQTTEGLQDLDLYRNVKDRLRGVPSKGFTYLPLRHYKDSATGATLALRPLLSFNYLGENRHDAPSWLQLTDEPAAADHGASVGEPFRLDVLSRISAGELQLTLRGEAPRADVPLAVLAAAWQQELGALSSRLQGIAAGHDAGHGLLSLSDSLVPFATLAELDATLAALQLSAADVEEILPLTGVQSGMWLHCATHAAAYQDQVVLRLQQALDEPRFAAAAAALVAGTQALRSGFAQTVRGELLQLVWRERSGSYRYVDALAAGDDSEALAARLRAETRGRRRDLLRDPLFSLTLVRLAADCHELIIDFHHMALDGWSSALLLQRLEALYFGDARAGDAGAPGGMRPYFEWLGRQSTMQARDYWHTLLGDYQGRSEVPTHLPRVPPSEPEPVFVEVRTGTALHAALAAWCGQQGLTVNAVVQSLWGLFLGRLTGSDDVVFGATVSGRDIDLAGVDTIAGMLINTLPVRIDIGTATSFAELVRRTAQQFADSMAFGHLGLADIMALTPARGALVTHALVFENYPAADAAAARWHWQPQDIFDPMHFEFGLIVAPLADDLGFRFVADGSLYLRERLERWGSELCTLLATLLDARQPFTASAATARGWSLSANFTADSLVGLLQYHEHLSGNSSAVTLLPYDQSVQELVNPGSRLRRLQASQHVVLWRPALDAGGSVDVSTTTAQLAQLAEALGSYARSCKGSQLYVLPCPWFACDWAQYREYAAYLKGALAGPGNAVVLGLEALEDEYALQQGCLPPAQVFGDIPYSEAFFAALASRLVRQRDLQQRRPVKVYVVDADDTLWGGVVGEDGPQGLRLDAVHIGLQQQLLQARAAGALICLATKNNEEDVRAVFEQREMPLRWHHLSRVCAGWGPKSQSILALAGELSLGLDSFVFIDDSPLECAQVLDACPGVLAIQLPPAEQRAAFLRHLWLLDARAATQEDARRAQMYAEELQRSSARKATGSYADFLASLDIRVAVQPLTPGDVARVAQLSQRTNQFNTCGLRLAEAELLSLQQAGTDIRCVRVQDRYGDYGLVGSVYVNRNADAWIVSGFMLSCRVLGRGVEHSILRGLAAEAAAAGVRELRVDFVKLPRNAPALQFLQSLDTAATAVLPGATHWQFTLPVAAAAQWQPGTDASAVVEEASDAAPHTQQQAVSADAARWSLRASGYYRHVAATLNSGNAILQALQQQGVVQQTGSVQRAAENPTPPATATEVAVAGYFAELLGQRGIGREDSFHALGGHSLKAMMLFSRIAADFGITLDFRDLQAAPTVAALAARIDAALAVAEPAAAAPALCALPLADSYPLSPGQSRLWMLEQLRGEGPSPFHMHVTLTTTASIDRVALQRALQAMLLRHEALRTCFREEAQGAIRQIVVPGAALECQVLWSDATVNAAEIDVRAQQHSAMPFDLQQAPLLRIAAGALAEGGNVLFITMHHIISDGWSMAIFARGLSDLYHRFSNGGSTDDAAEHSEMQFRDYAQWQLQWLQSEAGARAVGFWRDHFADPVEPLQLPCAAPRPALVQNRGAAVTSDIAAPLWSSFTRAVATRGLSEFAGLFAALQLVLARLSSQHNFCIGTAVAGRPHAALESLIGFFVNVLPLRSTLDTQATVAHFLSAVGDEVNACLSQQGVPFDSIVAGLDLERDPGRSPLFDVLLVLQNTEAAELHFGAQAAVVHPVATTTTQYDLTLSAFPAADGSLQLVAEYNAIIYAPADIELLLRCLQHTLQGLADSVAGNLQRKWLELPWLPEADAALVTAFEGRLLEAAPEFLPDLVRTAARHSQNSISDARQRWSYRELEQEMLRIAALLWASAPLRAREHRQLHVGVIGRRSVHSIAALLGVMEAGAVYVPLDLSNPPDRLRTIIDEGEVDVLLSTDAEGAALGDALQQQSDSSGAGLLHLRHDAAVPGLQRLSRRADTNAIAYMIFTSGSTGKPKGVQIPHAAFSAMIRQQIPLFDVQPQDVCGQFAALSFDASLSEIFLALGTGAALAIAPDEARGDIDAFMAWLDAAAVTVLTLPPVFLRALQQRPLGRLRVLVTAGEAAVAADLRHYAAALRVLNAYGPTETSVCASAYHVNPVDAWPFGVPIGAPLPGVLLSVRDANGQRVPVGVTGELYIGGGSVGAGYHGAAALTAEKFTSLPGMAGRWYRSGDRVRWRSDGQLEFLGRTDSQVKLRGYRIEPGEIEHAARALAGVADAAALVHPELGLLLFCVAAPPQPEVFRTTLLDELGRVLPRYMLPADVLLLDRFPQSAAGKIERRALLALASARTARFEVPVTQEERALAQTWCEALRLPQVGRDDEFFALGGDSIKALDVLSRLRVRGYTCALKDFFAAPRLRALARLLASAGDAASDTLSVVGRVELLPVQDWFLRSRSTVAAQHFHIAAELKVRPQVTVTLLKQVVAMLVQHHPALRAGFHQQADGQWVQEIQQAISPDAVVAVHRCSTGTDDEDRAAVQALACRPFALERAPLVRLVLVQTAAGSSSTVVLVLHHLIADWVSLRILLADMNALAATLSAAAEVAPGSAWLPPPQLLQQLARQRAAVRPDLHATQQGREFREAVATMRQCTHERGTHSALQTLHLRLAADELALLREALRQMSAGESQHYRLQDVMLAMTMLELGELFTLSSLPVLIESHGRDDDLDLSRQVGWLTQAQLLNLDLAAFTAAPALAEARRALQRPAADQPDVFACVAAGPGTLDGLPAMLSFNYLGEFGSTREPDAAFELTDTVFEQAMARETPVDVPLHLEFYVVNGALEVQVAWSPGVFDTLRMRACWERVRRRLICFPASV